MLTSAVVADSFKSRGVATACATRSRCRRRTINWCRRTHAP